LPQESLSGLPTRHGQRGAPNRAHLRKTSR